MPYSPGTWVENTTVIHATDMQRIEQGIVDNATAIASLAAETVSTVAASGTAQTFALVSGAAHTWDVTLTGNLTPTFTGAVAGKSCVWTLLLRQDGTGNRTIVWPANIGWASQTEPTLSTSNVAYDVIQVLSVDGGTTLIGVQSASRITPYSVPGQVPSLTATKGNTTMDLAWTSPASGGRPITAYKVYRGTATGTETLLTTLGNVLTFHDTGLTNGTVYWYKVSAVNSIGEGALSPEAHDTPGIGGLPSLTTGTLQLRLAADQITSPPSTGSALGTWNDVSGNALHATQATGSKQPLYETGVVNGLPTVRFDGVDDVLQSTYTWPADNLAVFVVCKASSLSANRTPVGAAATGGLDLRIDTAGTITANKQFTATIGTSSSGNAGTSAFHVLAFTASSDVGAGTRNTHFTIDGNDTSISSAVGWPLTTSLAVTIGEAINAGSPLEPFVGDIAEVIVYTGSGGGSTTGVSSTDRKSIEAYLGSKYGITITP